MKSIVFFSRLRLADLYGSIHEYLSNDYEIIHLAYSKLEAQKLEKRYNIKNVLIFKELIGNIYNDFVYEPEFNDHIDMEIVSISGGRFNLNQALQNDRTFQILTLEESLILCQIYFKFWSDFLQKNNVQYLFHEPPSLFLNHIASLLCEKSGATYVNMNIAQGFDENNWIVYEKDTAYAFELNFWLKNSKIDNEDVKRVEELITNFRQLKTNWLPQLNNKEFKSKKKLILKYLKYCFYNFRTKKKDSINILDHVDEYQVVNTNKYNSYKFINEWFIVTKLKYSDYSPKENYYYYPMHLEPEAVVLYYGDGIYKDQIKLIENIAGSLPANNYLYVKDHPHSKHVRHYSEYLKLKAIPNVRLLNPTTSGRSIIENSKGIITINGSSGFEGLLYGKKVYAFGRIFYTDSPNCYYIRNIRDLRQVLYETQHDPFENDRFKEYLTAYLKSIHRGFTLFYTNKPELSNVNISDNAMMVAMELRKYLQLKKNLEK